MRWILTAAVVTAALVVGGAVALRFLRPSVVVTEAVEGPVVQAFYSTGTIQPVREFPIKSNTAGILTDVRVDKGARVKKGDVLALVSDPQLRYTGSGRPVCDIGLATNRQWKTGELPRRSTHGEFLANETEPLPDAARSRAHVARIDKFENYNTAPLPRIYF